MNRGYVKVWRKIQDSGLMQMPNTLALFMYILLNATHKDTKVGTTTGVIELKRGQYISGRKVLASNLKQSEREIRTSLERLVELQILTIKSTNKYSVYTIENYDNYQGSDQETTNTETNKRPSNDQQTTTKQELKNLRNKKASSEISLASYIEQCKQAGVAAIPENDKVFEFAENAGIPLDYLRVAWIAFRDEFVEKTDKRQKDWVQTFRNYVRNDYLKVWAFAKDSGECFLTTKGKQIQSDMEKKQK